MLNNAKKSEELIQKTEHSLLVEKTTPILSIIIPTKNRYTTLIPVVDAILKYVKSDNFELIIQDNSTSNSEMVEYMNNIEDDRVKYYYVSQELSITDNTILAIEKTHGKYITFIGDDDFVSPYICEIVEMINKKDIYCLIYSPAYYWWKSVDFLKENHYYRKQALWIPNNISLDLVKYNAKEELNAVLQNGASSYSRMPKFYHGIVKKDVLEKIKARTGTYLPGSCPDMAFAVGISLVIDDFHFINYPVSVFGASSNSGGGMTANKKHYGKIEDQKFLPKDIVNKWDPLIPRVWSERSIYAQTSSEVLKAFGSELKLNYLSLYATMLAYEPFLISYIRPAIISYCKYSLILYTKILVIYSKRVAGIYLRKYKMNNKKLGYSVEIIDTADKVMGSLNDLPSNNNLAKAYYGQ